MPSDDLASLVFFGDIMPLDSVLLGDFLPPGDSVPLGDLSDCNDNKFCSYHQ